MRLPVLTLAVLLIGAGEATPEQADFMKRARAAGTSHDAKAFSQLYCEPAKAKPATDMLQFFTKAHYGEPAITKDRRAEFALSMCFERPTAKEMCYVFSVAHVSNQLCILDPLLKG